MHKISVAVDLDGVLAEYHGWQGIDHIGDPLPGAAEFTRRLQQMARVVIFTTRVNPDPAIQEGNESGEMLIQRVRLWLNAHQIPYDEIYAGPGKPLAAAYVDDRAVVCCRQRNAEAYEFALGDVERLIGECK